MHRATARLIANLALVPLALVGCASDPPLDGTYAGESVIRLPSPPLPDVDLTIDSVIEFDSATSRFTLDMDLEAAGLTDAMQVRGGYVTANGMLTLRPDTIEPAEGMGSERSVGADGSQCVSLGGFALTVVCIPESTSSLTRSGSGISFSLESRIADVPRTVPMTLTLVP